MAVPSDSLLRAAQAAESAYIASSNQLVKSIISQPLKSAPYTFLEHPFVMTLVVVCILVWLLREPLRQYALRRAALAAGTAVVPVMVPATSNLAVEHEHLLNLLRQRDRLLLDYLSMKRPYIPTAAYEEWHERTWKAYAANRLALLQAVRPLVYADYRGCIVSLSPTFGTLPGPALRALTAVSAIPLYVTEVTYADVTDDNTAEVVYANVVDADDPANW